MNGVGALVGRVRPGFSCVCNRVRCPRATGETQLRMRYNAVSILVSRVVDVTYGSDHSMVLTPCCFGKGGVDLVSLSKLLTSVVDTTRGLSGWFFYLVGLL